MRAHVRCQFQNTYISTTLFLCHFPRMEYSSDTPHLWYKNSQPNIILVYFLLFPFSSRRVRTETIRWFFEASYDPLSGLFVNVVGFVIDILRGLVLASLIGVWSCCINLTAKVTISWQKYQKTGDLLSLCAPYTHPTDHSIGQIVHRDFVAYWWPSSALL